jgi:hypothetical protein
MLNPCQDSEGLNLLLSDIKAKPGKAKSDCTQAKLPYDELASLLQDDFAPILNHKRKLSVLKDSVELTKEKADNL